MARADRGSGIDGILVLAKPAGPTSHDMVAVVRRLTGTRRVGHGGTLDPFASGVLPIFLGLGTRIVEYHMADGKAYRATVCFGARSTTDDRDGELEPVGSAPTREAVLGALAAFRGPIEQRPPTFSALKVGGRRAYQLAREGHPAELAPRSVTIGRLELVEWDDADPARPTATLEVECSAGTYIRALARDLGERLGSGAYLGALVRTASGPFRLAAAHSLDELRAAAAAGPARLRRLILPIDTGLESIPALTLGGEQIEALARGQQVKPVRRPHGLAQGASVRLQDASGALLGMAVWRAGRAIPDKVFVAPPERSDRPKARPTGGAPGGSQSPGAGPGAPAASGRPAGAGRDVRLRTALPEACVEVVNGLDALRPELGRVYVAVGVFDGLHRGHSYLLRHLRRAARRADARAAVITFDAHPEEVIRGVAPPLLCDPDERIVRLAAAGVEVTVVQHFDAALRSTSYERFVAMIRERVELAGFLMTPDAAFGYERRGTPESLTELGGREGFEVTVVPALLVGGEQVRSSEIRRDVADGRLDHAERLLGRPFAVAGRLAVDPTDAADAADAAGPGQSGADSGQTIRFELPVALPPDGRYGVLVGPAWQPGEAAEPATLEATAVVDGGELTIECGGSLPSGDRLRVVFVAPAERAAAGPVGAQTVEADGAPIA